MTSTIREARDNGTITREVHDTLQARKRAVKYHARQGGCTAEEAAQAAASYEAELAAKGFPLAHRPNRYLRDMLADFRAAQHAWDLECEAVAIGYDTEIAEYAELHPRPTLRDWLCDRSEERRQHRSDWAA